jgi:hypothetical protein
LIERVGKTARDIEMQYQFVKFGLAAFASMLLGSHVVYKIYEPMSVGESLRELILNRSAMFD